MFMIRNWIRENVIEHEDRYSYFLSANDALTNLAHKSVGWPLSQAGNTLQT